MMELRQRVDSREAYLEALRAAVARALCLRDFPSQTVERQSKPEVEMGDNKELLSQPVHIISNIDEAEALIEGSINSVRVSLRLANEDDLDDVLSQMYTKFMMQRAETLLILRRAPIEDYHISFLITDRHLRQFGRQQLLSFVSQFAEEVSKQMGQLKQEIGSRGRTFAQEFFKGF